MNIYAIRAIYHFEMARMFRTVVQSIVAPVLSTSLFRFTGPFGTQWEVISAGGVAPGYRPVLPAAWCSLATVPDSCLDPVSAEGPVAKLVG